VPRDVEQGGLSRSFRIWEQCLRITKKEIYAPSPRLVGSNKMGRGSTHLDGHIRWILRHESCETLSPSIGAPS
jgi:hypothetical protein